MNILITGCNGQLGNEMQLLEKEYPQHNWFNTDVQELDITDQLAINQFVAEHQIDGVVNCAAYTAVDKAEDNKELCTTLNTVAPAYLAAAVDKRGGWMIQISTDYVFDGTKHTPYVETDTPCPNSVYGSTKLAGEIGVTKFCKRSMIVRTAWLYSTFGNNFVKTMIRLGKEKPELGVIFDQIGTPTYARDLSNTPTGRHYYMSCPSVAYCGISHSGTPSPLFRARQDEDKEHLSGGNSVLGRESRSLRAQTSK